MLALRASGASCISSGGHTIACGGHLVERGGYSPVIPTKLSWSGVGADSPAVESGKDFPMSAACRPSKDAVAPGLFSPTSASSVVHAGSDGLLDALAVRWTGRTPVLRRTQDEPAIGNFAQLLGPPRCSCSASAPAVNYPNSRELSCGSTRMGMGRKPEGHITPTYLLDIDSIDGPAPHTLFNDDRIRPASPDEGDVLKRGKYVPKRKFLLVFCHVVRICLADFAGSRAQARC
ncbi:hypothetical protein R3P38DRAFT_1317529 [Favolaschia claudopus]|uniref:Uncharacterized protein n=1 Tax=Favolaschia claudopus TaxID=2862362 RepID=A0AAW0AXB4_9AGAR